jgi:transposase-like protein
VPVPPDAEVPARPARRRFTTAYKLEVLRRADACTRPGELGALLRREGLYSSHVATWRRQREHGLTAKKRGRKATASDSRVKTLEREKAALVTENRRLERRLQRAETIIAYQKKVATLLEIPLDPLPSDEAD